MPKRKAVKKQAKVKSNNHAGFWLRFLAYLIDTIIVGAVGTVLVLTAAFPLTLTVGSLSPAQLVYGMFIIAFIFLGQWLYYALMESSRYQATVGKIALKLKVVDYSGERLTFWRATGRFFAKFLSMIILYIGFLMIGWTEKKQGLHDMIAETYVVKE